MFLVGDVDVAVAGDADLWELVGLATALDGWTPLRPPMAKPCGWPECDDAVVAFDGDGDGSAADDETTEVCSDPCRERHHRLRTCPCWLAERA